MPDKDASADRLELLERLLREEDLEASDAAEIRPRHHDGELPLSFAQRQLWFLDQLAAARAVYNVPYGLRLRGTLDAPALERALAEIVRRHEALRATFAISGDEPVQGISPSGGGLAVQDLGSLPEGERQEAVRRIAAEEAGREFDLARGPLVRTRLVRLGEEEHLLLLTMHHIVFDGWSMGVLFRELEALYAAFREGRPSPLPEPPLQYADYACWQRDWLQGEVLHSQLAYWRARLGQAPALLELPADRPRPAVQSFRGAREPFVVPQETLQILRVLGRREGATLFMVLLAAFKALLLRYTGQEDVVVGTPIAGRGRAELEGLIGFFVNTLVLRTDLSGDPTFRELLGRVREVTLGAYTHQDLPFERLVEDLHPQRDLSRNPLFQVMFVLQNVPMQPPRLPGLEVEVREGDSGTSKFDLTLILEERGEGLCGWLEYSTDLFDPERIRRLAEHYQTLLQGIAADPAERLSRLPILTEAERRQVLVEWNDTASAYPREASIPELFEAEARRRPEAVAVVCGDERLSYGELKTRTDRLADRLRALGVGLETVVGIAVERSLEMVVGLLGILKAGGAYLPLDPALPSTRLRFLLQDAGVTVALTQRRHAQRLSEQPVRLVCLDEEVLTESVEPRQGGQAGADDLAYVMYTSGTTGRPKGVRVTHRGVVRLVKGTNYASFGEQEVFLQFAPLSFDASTLEIWGALLNGGRLVMFPQQRASLEELGEAIRRHGVTTLWLTAGLFHQMVEGRLEDLAGLRQLLAGGEVLSPAHVRKAVDRLRPCRVINGYGPTENTTFTCCHPMTDGAQVGPTVSIGRPIAHTRVYVLDAHLEPVPVGVPGELYIGGDGLARDYLNHPELTAEKFVPDAFSGETGARLYRTGDITRHLADGTLEFLGRRDSQVKLRGFRIELGEIESVLGEHPGVAEAAVAVREDAPADKRLVAYVVPRGSEAPAPRELRGFLKERLPEHMVPALFVTLQALPLTPNGKVDRRALPAPDRSGAVDGAADQAPRTPLEEALATLWAELLGLDRVGVHQDFFDLGGHSLLATQLLARLRKLLRAEVPIRDFFESPTIAALAQRMEALLHARSAPPPLEPYPRSGRLLLTFGQQRLWFLDQLLPGSSLYNMPCPLRLAGPLDGAALERAIAEIVRRHESLRTTFVSIEGQPWQVVAEATPLTLPTIDLTHLDEGERERQALRLTEQEAREPFDLARGPLLRTTLLRLGERSHILLTTMHHIVSDGWSMGVFFRELAALYPAFIEGRPSPLPEPRLQYADFSRWQRECLRGEVLESHLTHWIKTLAGPLPELRLPTDRDRRSVKSMAGAVRFSTLPATLADGLRGLARRERATLFMILLAAFKALLFRYTAQDDIVVGTPIAGRNQAGMEGLIGLFVNTLALRTDLSGQPTFLELVRRIREITLEAYAHQDLPFDKLVEELHPARDPGNNPLFQVMFAFQEARRPLAALGSVAAAPIDVGNGEAPFDLTFYVTESESELQLAIEYRSALFEDSTVDRMMRHYQELLEEVVADPGRLLAELPPLGSAAPVARAAAAMARASGDEARRVSLLARRARLSPRRQALLQQRLAGAPTTEKDRALSGGCLVPIQPTGKSRPLFCVHPAGGDVMCYLALARCLGPEQPLLGLQSAGLHEGLPLSTIEAMAARYVTEIRQAQRAGPYLLAGWSLGGAVAFEMARQLVRDAETVGLLAIVDTEPGGSRRPIAERPRFDEENNTRWLVAIAEYVAGLWGRELAVSEGELIGLGFEEQLQLFLARLKGVGFLPTEATLIQLQRLLAVFKANSRAWYSYVPEPYSGPIMLFKARVGNEDRDPALGWHELTSEPVGVHMIPGDHLTLMAEPNVRILAERLEACLKTVVDAGASV